MWLFQTFKDRNNPLVLGTKKLVQLQIKVTNLFNCSTLITLFRLILSILITTFDIYKSNLYAFCVKKRDLICLYEKLNAHSNVHPLTPRNNDFKLTPVCRRPYRSPLSLPGEMSDSYCSWLSSLSVPNVLVIFRSPARLRGHLCVLPFTVCP